MFDFMNLNPKEPHYLEIQHLVLVPKLDKVDTPKYMTDEEKDALKKQGIRLMQAKK